MMLDLKGQRYGRLIVGERAGTTRSGKILWRCRCSCGASTLVTTSDLRGKRRGTVSCGCYRKEKFRASTHRLKHGAARGTATWPEYNAWATLKHRCLNPKYPKYADYGGRGITVCDRWRNSFVNFLVDMGRKPSSGHSIDRFPDIDGNFEPGNCRWATREQKRNNQRRMHAKRASGASP
jgi:hypothetical protein